MNRRIIIISIVVFAFLLAVVVLQSCRHHPVPAASVSTQGTSSPSRKEIAALAVKAHDLEQANSYPEAKDAYQKLASDHPGSPDSPAWQKKSEELAMKLFYSSTITPKSTHYEVKPGDSLYKIAKEYKTTPELIRRMNNMSDTRIVPGRKLKVWNASFSLYVSKSKNILVLKCGEDTMKTFTVSTGSNNSTPVGTYKITTKLTNPTWFKAGAVVSPADADNQLGTRWMGFNLAGYGIHGTIHPEQLGKQVTAGCVRMSNVDVEELYDIVTAGTEVTIVD